MIRFRRDVREVRLGHFRTWSDVRFESVVRTKADSTDYHRFNGFTPQATVAAHTG